MFCVHGDGMSWRLPQECEAWPLVMGILNVTPDSFSDGGRFDTVNTALLQAQRMLDFGADIIDVGGESTRPGAPAVDAHDERARVIPVIKALKANTDAIICVDTTKSIVMEEAVAAGADMINDVTALTGTDSLSTAAKLNIPLCLMHMRGSPRTMQSDPVYDDVVTHVRDYLSERVEACVLAGIDRSQIVVDPGFGFGKSVEHNLQLFRSLQEVAAGQPVLVGVSRKSMIGAVLERKIDERLIGSVALAALATWMGAAIIRVHDVAETVDAVRMITAVRQADSIVGCDSTDKEDKRATQSQ